jgi:hypothetical protein
MDALIDANLEFKEMWINLVQGEDERNTSGTYSAKTDLASVDSGH